MGRLAWERRAPGKRPRVSWGSLGLGLGRPSPNANANHAWRAGMPHLLLVVRARVVLKVVVSLGLGGVLLVRSLE
eukprot:scaffold95488_cov27-Phaeocystis_antarctica.AAC.1